MTTTLNYILEANLALLLTLGFYTLFLRKETNFKVMRMYLLLSIFVSLLFPLADVQYTGEPSPVAISRLIPSYWLPEVVISAGNASQAHEASLSFWKYAGIVYVSGLALCSVLVILQLMHLVIIFRKATTYEVDNLHIAESMEDKPTFSFFNFVFIGKAQELSAQEKQHIIRHESVHSQQWHSLDILLINILKVFFWFNPFINTYKKNFIQLHEFEADARAVENADVNKYCSLLARVALRSADFRLANHFNNSLTVKRIEMMKKIKTNIRQWKLVALALVFSGVFVFIACQDQVEDDMKQITQNSSHALIVPAKIQERYEQLKNNNPQKNYALLELNETATQKLEELKSKYGLPQTIEVFPVEGNTVLPAITGESSAGMITFERNATKASERRQTFAIIEFDENASRISEAAAQDDKIFTVVEHQPEFPGGYNAMIDFIRENLRYPLEARQKGIEGTVYASFVIDSNGSISSVNILRGISPDCDQEVKRMVEMFPKWIPGKQSGKNVSVRFVLPVKFAL